MSSDETASDYCSDQELMELGDAFLVHCQEVVLEKGIPAFGVKFLCGGLFIRCIDLFYSLKELAFRGHSVGASIILRTLFEAAVYHEACATNQDAQDAYLASQHSGRKKLLNKILASKTPFMASLQQQITEERRTEILESADKVCRTWSFERFAKLVDMEDWYILVYTLTSADVHANPMSVVKSFEEDTSSDSISGTVGPSDGLVRQQLCHGGLLMAVALKSFLTVAEWPGVEVAEDWVDKWGKQTKVKRG
jgi:hypothetical protein